MLVPAELTKGNAAQLCCAVNTLADGPDSCGTQHLHEARGALSQCELAVYALRECTLDTGVLASLAWRVWRQATELVATKILRLASVHLQIQR